MFLELLNETKHTEYLEKHGIKTEGTGLGFSEEEQKYFGWSHRGICGFSISDVVKEGDVTAGELEVGFKAKTLEDAKKMAKAFAESVS